MKKIFLNLLLIITLLLMVACGTENDSTDSEELDQLRVGASSSSSWVYGFMSTWSEVLQRNNSDLDIVVQSTAGAGVHYQLIEEGQVEIAGGFVPSEYLAINGEGNFSGEDFSKLNVLAPTSLHAAHIVTSADSTIKNVHDLNDARIGIGAKGQTGSMIAERHIEILDINAELVHSEPDEMINMMRDGRIDAFWYHAGPPWSSVLDLSSQMDIKFVDFSDEDYQKVANDEGYPVIKVKISDAYDFVEENIYAPGATTSMLVSSDLDEELVYELTKTTWEQWDDIVNIVPSAGDVDINDIVNLYGTIHPGALRYYEEVNIEIPDDMK